MIYMAYNPISEKYYIGQTVDLARRKREHKGEANSGCSFSFHRALRKYGVDIFEWRVLSDDSSSDGMNSRETLLIWAFRADDPDYGYNMSVGGVGGGMLGRKHTDESKQKMSKALKGRVFSPETLARMSAAQKGKQSPKKGKPQWSEEEKKRIGDIHRGKRISEQQKKLISESLKGRLFSIETRQKISAALKGRKAPWNKKKIP
jgi:group I intron endonuclease